MYNKIVVGIDESYTRTGISICADNKVLKVLSIDFKGCKNNTEKRNLIRDKLKMIFNKVSGKAEETIIICEKIRTFSQGFLSTNYIKSTGALISVIVDIAYKYDIEVYSVDTRSWKSQVVGTSKGGKEPTIKFACRLGFKHEIVYKNKKGNTKYNDDIADAICIGLYGYIPKIKQKLKPES